MLKLKLQYFGHAMRRTNSLEKTLMLGKIEGERRRGWQRMRWLDGITNAMDMNLSELCELVDGQGGLACCSPWGRKEPDTTEQLNWTDNDLKFKVQNRSYVQTNLIILKPYTHKLKWRKKNKVKDAPDRDFIVALLGYGRLHRHCKRMTSTRTQL